MQSAAGTPLLSSPTAGGSSKGPLPRILAAAAIAVLLHGALLLGNGTGATSTALRSTSLAIRFIETSANKPDTSVLELSTATPAANLAKPEPGPRPPREERPPLDGTTAKPARLSVPSERGVLSGSAQPVGPVVAATPEPPSADRSAHGLADAPDYLSARLLSVGPRPLDDIQPQYPEAADLRTGKVVLRLLISDTGHVDDVAVVRATPPGLFDASALEAFAKARFSPGLAGGVAVKSQMTVEIEFVPLNRLSRISGRSY